MLEVHVPHGLEVQILSAAPKVRIYMGNIDDKLFYVGQKAFIDKDGEVLVLFDQFVGLDFPGGKIQEGETNIEEALKREVREETSLEIEVGGPFQTWLWQIRRGENAGKYIFLVGYRCKYVSGDVKLSDEHSEFKWVNKDTYKEVDQENPYFKYLEDYFKGA